MGHQPSPLLYGPAGPQGLVGLVAYVGPIGRGEPFALSKCHLPFTAATLREHPSSYLMTPLSPSPPLYRTSFVSLAPGLLDNGTEPIRWFEKTALRAAIGPRDFFIIISIRRALLWRGIYDGRRMSSAHTRLRNSEQYDLSRTLSKIGAWDFLDRFVR